MLNLKEETQMFGDGTQENEKTPVRLVQFIKMFTGSNLESEKSSMVKRAGEEVASALLEKQTYLQVEADKSPHEYITNAHARAVEVLQFLNNLTTGSFYEDSYNISDKMLSIHYYEDASGGAVLLLQPVTIEGKDSTFGLLTMEKDNTHKEVGSIKLVFRTGEKNQDSQHGVPMQMNFVFRDTENKPLHSLRIDMHNLPNQSNAIHLDASLGTIGLAEINHKQIKSITSSDDLKVVMLTFLHNFCHEVIFKPNGRDNEIEFNPWIRTTDQHPENTSLHHYLTKTRELLVPSESENNHKRILKLIGEKIPPEILAKIFDHIKYQQAGDIDLITAEEAIFRILLNLPLNQEINTNYDSLNQPLRYVASQLEILTDFSKTNNKKSTKIQESETLKNPVFREIYVSLSAHYQEVVTQLDGIWQVVGTSIKNSVLESESERIGVGEKILDALLSSVEGLEIQNKPEDHTFGSLVRWISKESGDENTRRVLEVILTTQSMETKHFYEQVNDPHLAEIIRRAVEIYKNSHIEETPEELEKNIGAIIHLGLAKKMYELLNTKET